MVEFMESRKDGADEETNYDGEKFRCRGALRRRYLGHDQIFRFYCRFGRCIDVEHLHEIEWHAVKNSWRGDQRVHGTSGRS